MATYFPLVRFFHSKERGIREIGLRVADKPELSLLLRAYSTQLLLVYLAIWLK